MLFSILVLATLVLAYSAFERPILEAWNLHLLDSADEATRWSAAKELGRLHSRRAVPKLTACYRESIDDDTGAYFAEALWRIGPAGRDELIATLEEATTDRADSGTAGSSTPPPGRLTRGHRRGPVFHLLKLCAAEPSRFGEILERLDARLLADPGRETAWVRRAIPSLVDPIAVRGAWFAIPSVLESLRKKSLSPALRSGLLAGLRDLRPIAMAASIVPVLEAMTRDREETIELRSAAYQVLDVFHLPGGPDPPWDTAALTLTDAAGPAGGEASLELRARFERPLDIFYVEIDAEGDAIESARVDAAGTASEGAPPSAHVSGRKRPGGGHLAGVQYSLVAGGKPLEGGEDVLLARVVLKLRSDAAPGERALRVISSELSGVGARSLKIEIARVGVLRVLPPAATAAVDASQAAPSSSTAAGAGFTLEAAAAGIELSWAGFEPAPERIEVHRDGEFLVELPGDAARYVDPHLSEILTSYRIEASAGGEPIAARTATLNAVGERPLIEAELVPARPGQKGVAVRILATCAEASQGLSFGLRVEPQLATIAAMTQKGAVTEELELRSFLFQEHVLDRGETAVGVLDISPPLAELPPGVRQHVATAIIDLPVDGSAGSEVPIDIGNFGQPKGDNVFSVRGGQSAAAAVLDGAILVGESPLAPVVNAGVKPRIEELAPTGAAGAGPRTRAKALELRWTNAIAYDEVLIERDGQPIAALAGREDRFVDPAPGPGPHRYAIRGRVGERRSFPVVVYWPVRR
jgi:hypothetical protein